MALRQMAASYVVTAGFHLVGLFAEILASMGGRRTLASRPYAGSYRRRSAQCGSCGAPRPRGH